MVWCRQALYNALSSEEKVSLSPWQRVVTNIAGVDQAILVIAVVDTPATPTDVVVVLGVAMSFVNYYFAAWEREHDTEMRSQVRRLLHGACLPLSRAPPPSPTPFT